MSIFKNSKFSKATAYIASAVSLVPMLSKDCSSVKVFAEGNDDGNEGTKKESSFFSNALSKVLLWFIFVKGLFKQGVDYVGSLIKGKGEEGKENKNKVNEEEEKKNDPSYEEYVLRFGQKLLKELLNFAYQDSGEKRVCSRSLLLVLDELNLIERDDDERYGKFVPDLNRRKVFEALGKIAILESEKVSFSEDEQKNIMVRNTEQNVGFTFDLDEEGNFLAVYDGNNSKVKFPFRIIAKDFKFGARQINDDRGSYFEGCSVFYALSFLDNKALMKCLLHKDFDVFEKDSFDGYRPTKMLEKLIEVFRKKDKTGKLLKKAKKSLRMFKFMERFSKGLECYGRDEYHEKLLKKIFDDNVLVEGEDKETLNEFRRLAVDYLAKLYSLYSADNLKELNNMSEEVKKELRMDTEGFDFKNNSTGENLFSENQN